MLRTVLLRSTVVLGGVFEFEVAVETDGAWYGHEVTPFGSHYEVCPKATYEEVKD